jgi:hypothetical protein
MIFFLKKKRVGAIQECVQSMAAYLGHQENGYFLSGKLIQLRKRIILHQDNIFLNFIQIQGNENLSHAEKNNLEVRHLKEWGIYN